MCVPSGTYFFTVYLEDRTGAATLSVAADPSRVLDFSLARFTANDANGHPWSGDPLLRGDQSYCKAALG